MNASTLFFFGWIGAWILFAMPDMLSDDYDGILSPNFEWNVTFALVTIGAVIVITFIWIMFNKWINARYVVFNKKDKDQVWRYVGGDLN